MEPTQQNIDRLKKARTVCKACGERYGDLDNANVLYRRGTCEVCDKLTAVTGSETFNFLYRGLCAMRRRKAAIEREAKRAAAAR